MKTIVPDAKQLKLFRYTNTRLREEGYETPYEFYLKSGVPYSNETVQKAFNPCEYKRLGADTLAVILKYLNTPAPEIRRVLRDMTDDSELWTLLPEEGGGQALTRAEEAWLEIYHKTPPEMLAGVLGALTLLGNLIADEVAVLRRGA